MFAFLVKENELVTPRFLISHMIFEPSVVYSFVYRPTFVLVQVIVLCSSYCYVELISFELKSKGFLYANNHSLKTIQWKRQNSSLLTINCKA